MSNSESQRIESIVVDWARAVSAGDRKGILDHHSADLLMFDFPDSVEGIDGYNGTWDFFYANRRDPSPTSRPTFA